MLLIMAVLFSSRARHYGYLCSAVCRCGWELPANGCLMTALFSWRVSPRHNQERLLWQEIAVEEDWASCCAGAVWCCSLHALALFLFPFHFLLFSLFLFLLFSLFLFLLFSLLFLFLSIAPSLPSPLNCSLLAGNGIV